jgi:hypothetical protein
VAEDLFDRMAAAGHAAFALSAASEGLSVGTERERALVDAAVTAGVVGALSVIREDSPPDAKA